jgi:hypothetical protein
VGVVEILLVLDPLFLTLAAHGRAV